MRPAIHRGMRAVWVVLLGCVAIAARGESPGPANLLQSLRTAHPRLMLNDERLSSLKTLAQSDETLRGYMDAVRKDADALLVAKPLEHELIGPRLLSVSRECLQRVYTLGLAWRWTGDEKYARAAEANLLTVCAFADWNPKHFLDVAEMSNAVGVGYDWLHAWLKTDSSEKIRKALIDLGLREGIKIYESGKGWTISDFNWNQVCNGGMIVGALAVAETDGELARYIIPRAVASLPKALQSYDPDGAWMEGPSYWGYATRYTAYGLCALDTALGTDFGLSQSPGLRQTGYFPLYATGPTGMYLNYADAGDRGKRHALPCLFWLASKYGNTDLSDAEHLSAQAFGAAPEHVIWYMPPSGKPPAARDRDRHFAGKVDVVLMRSSWDDPQALFVGVKGGYNEVNHGHLDLGNFEMDALGVRWVRDLGKDDYNLPGYFNKAPGGKRWNYYRNNSESHSVPMIDGNSQEVRAAAKLLRFKSRDKAANAIFDLSAAYPAASEVTREVALIDRRRAVRIHDRFALKQRCSLVWGLTTDAEIELPEDNTARLTLGGHALIARIESPKGVRFSMESAERPKPEARNKGVRRLLVKLPGAEGCVSIDVVLAPVWDENAAQ